MIAAGEVVQRPASVVKELMENALDAGATEVNVALTDAGRTLIRVVDDGCGMSPDDAVLCFERHATSKIATAEDLSNILTFGFRGEALASIAAVAEVTLRTRREEDEVGCEVQFAASEHLSTKEVAAPKGSSFSVRNLFYNIPARRKFLKSDNVEFKHVVEEFTRVALTREDVRFTLSHNGRDVFVLKQAQSLKFRIQDLLGSGVVGDILDVTADTSTVYVSGFVGRPESARKTLGNQFFFVNGRYFRSPYLHKAVMKAYENLIPEGVTPSYFLYLQIDPHAMDVNIHPTKTEIKFEDDSVIFQILFAAVRQALGKFSQAGSIDFDNPEDLTMPVIGKRFEEYTPTQAPSIGFDPNYDPFATPSVPVNPPKFPETLAQSAPSWRPAEKEEYGKLFEGAAMPSGQLMILGGKYILSKSRSGLLVTNIRRARERVLFDRFLSVIAKNGHASQRALFPVQVNVGVENRLVFDAKADLLSSLGFDITPFGTDTVVVNAVPDGFSAEPGKVQTLVGDLILILSDETVSLPERMESALAEKFAVLGASSSAPLDSTAEAQRLLDALMASQNPEYTSSGRKILHVIPLEEIDKHF
ncbi:MAG: DNA mismatch repair endonuclease MutL [Bacteroidales bacterium]|nr:DNA mismatch repair endonuclease MutL [Bacteroidales bacterium]